tara:strand:- start:297 stop:860 length:564 start_codon:yes stop_codon:yes gene_type:complete
MGTQQAYHHGYYVQQEQAAMAAIMGLVGELKQLAPHPDRPDYNGPLFLQNSPAFKQSDEHDTMLGMMIMEAMIGSAFAEGAAETFGDWAGDFDAAATLECYSEYRSDIEGATQKVAAHGQGTLARLSGQSISGGFNLRSTIDPKMQAFFDDLPKRMKIEQSLAYYLKQLEDARKPKAQPLAQPRFAA